MVSVPKVFRPLLCLVVVGLVLAGCGDSGGEAATSGGSGQVAPPPSDQRAAQETKVAENTEPVVMAPTVAPGAMMDIDQLYTQVAAQVSDWDWPANYQPDMAAWRARDQAPPDSQFQPGSAETMLQITNDCAWTLAWLDAFAVADADEMTTALDQLQRSADTYTEPSTKEFMQKMIDTARLNDPTYMQMSADANCQNDIWIQGASVAPFFRLIR